ncbi:LRP2-binding protein isoform X3 [Siphateles boraxobius]|uniref:LRP2-binding protein isoform X3 n=1 Tax=Siphateles boraxobius TaxID=180520 RepID=UPI004063C1E9
MENTTTSKFLNDRFSRFFKFSLTENDKDIREEMMQPEISAESVEKTVILLKEKAESGDSQAAFLLGQLHYEEGRYTEAEIIFDGIKDEDPRALYQLAVMYYDGLGTKEDLGKAMELMRRVALWDSSYVGSVRHAALYNLGRAYLEGYGVQASSDEAERLWLLAADDGNPNASVEAQSSLGMFYCRPETLDLTKKDPDSALFCLKASAERGNVYAQGHLTACYYQRKLYSRAAALGERVCGYEDTSAIARHTGCLEEFIRKGITIAMFYFARCLYLGRGVLQNRDRAKRYFTQAARMDPEICQELQMNVVHGRI